MGHRSSPQPRVVILRTSRFLETAVREARARWPGCELRVVYQAGCEVDVRASGIQPEPRLCIPPGPVTLRHLVCQPAFLALIAWRPDTVVLQWWNPRGDGHAAADRAALSLLPSSIVAVLEDESIVTMTWMARLCRPVTRVVRGGALILGVAGATLLAWPAYAWFMWCERRRLAGRN